MFLCVSSGSVVLESALKLARHYHHNLGTRWCFPPGGVFAEGPYRYRGPPHLTNVLRAPQ